MAHKSQRNKRGKYGNQTNEHIFFALVILLAAIIYANHAENLMSQQIAALKLTAIAIGIVGCLLVIKVLGKRASHSTAHRQINSVIDIMSGVEFERYIAKLLPRQGYSHIKFTEYYDFGVDIIADKASEKWGIQVKRYNTPVKMSAIRQAVAALKHYDCDRAMVITNNSFSSSAQELAKSNNCLLIDGQQLLRWAKDI
jgi:restriction system protein